jgi:hypothetical protein
VLLDRRASLVPNLLPAPKGAEGWARERLELGMLALAAVKAANISVEIPRGS